MGSAFVGFLSDMSSRQINHLYQSPWACLSVLRSLPSLAKSYVMRLLYVDEGIAREEIDAWVRPGKEHRDRHARSMLALKRLRVLVPAGDQEYVADGKELVRLNRRFVKGVRAQIETCFAPEGDEVEATVAPDDTMGGKRPKPEKIEEFAKGRWEALLMTLTGRDVKEFSLNPEKREEGEEAAGTRTRRRRALPRRGPRRGEVHNSKVRINQNGASRSAGSGSS